MALIVRRTWAQLRDEVIRRAGGIDASTWSGRVEYALWATHIDLCTSYHMFELDKIDTTLTLSTSVPSLALPTDCYIVVGVRLRDAATGNTVLNQLSYQAARILLMEYRNTPAARPKKYTRFLSTLYFDSLPDAAYHVDLYYYKNPTAPDFSSTSPETHPELDEHLIQGTLSTLFPSLGRPDLSTSHLQNLQTWLSLNTRPAMVAESPAGKTERFETVTSHGGQQG